MKEENKDWNYKYIEYDNPKKVKIKFIDDFEIINIYISVKE